MQLIALTLALILISSPAWATQYYLDPTCTFNGNGQATTCAASGGASGAFNTCASVTSLGTSSDVSIYAGTSTVNDPCTLNWSGTSGDVVLINSYNKGFIGLAKPILDGSALQSGAWTLESGAVYSATNSETFIPRVVTSDGTRLKYRIWNTDIATTITGTTSTGRNNKTDAMVAGTYTFNSTTHKIYVWLSGSDDPTTHTIRYSKAEAVLKTSGARSYITVDGIQTKMTQSGTEGSGVFLGWGTGSQCDNCSFTNVDSSLSGLRGLTIAGENLTMTDLTCTTSDWEGNPDNSGCIVLDGQASGETINNFNVARLTITNTNRGSCLEVNGNGTGGSATDITCNGGHIGIEVYGCSSGSCGGLAITNSTFDRISIDNTGYTGFDAFSRGMSFNSGVHGNTAKNLKIKNVEYAPIALTGADADGMAYQNNIYNATVYNDNFNTSSGSSAAIIFGNAATSPIGGNVLKNIVIKMDGVAGRCIYSRAGATLDIMDKIICATTGNYAIYNNTTYATLGLFQSAYTTATGLTYNSSSSDPLIDSTTLQLQAGSPAIGFGEVLAEVTTDYTGADRGITNDAGAYQYTFISGEPTRLGGGTYGGMTIQ